MSSPAPTATPTPARSPLSGWRTWFVYGLIIIGFVIMVGRLFKLQILDGASWSAQATENRISKISDQAPRGIIYDRNGYILARNIASYNVVITPALLPDDNSDVQDIYRQLSEL
jgi:penicillin-binding protein 2